MSYYEWETYDPEYEGTTDVDFKDEFLTITPRDGLVFTRYGSNKWLLDGIPLKIIRDNGVEVEPLIELDRTPMLRNPDGQGMNENYFINHGYSGVTFKVDVVIDVDDTVQGVINEQAEVIRNNLYFNKDIPRTKGSVSGQFNVLDAMEEIVKQYAIVNVVTKAIDIPDGLYMISANKSRKQTFHKTTIWSLEFTTFNGVSVLKFKNDNSKVLNAIKSAQKARKAYAAKLAKQAKKPAAKKPSVASTNRSKLAKCSLSKLKYSSKKKNVLCVQYLQRVLKAEKLYTRSIDGWYHKYTKDAVKKFQKKKKLKQTGTVNSATLKALTKTATKK